MWEQEEGPLTQMEIGLRPGVFFSSSLRLLFLPLHFHLPSLGHSALQHGSHLIRVIILPADAEIFMPSDHNLAFNKRGNGPDLGCTRGAYATRLSGLMHGDKPTAATPTAGNHI